ncbi:hypothetical protein LZZ85_11285 [Terrimonas sp. NA20]|uniref:Uncharacterized protein n=1 Tax=Terrimonas ginsenosidimutans TaxID=2908004 RepID=A0ABS9KRC8_9BACT|nr:hypothetical protein [Terrimonas ginsenosidimutans]MCG2614871.1 hypothetical protein [Terrimonas ginsenosidimutans]
MAKIPNEVPNSLGYALVKLAVAAIGFSFWFFILGMASMILGAVVGTSVSIALWYLMGYKPRIERKQRRKLNDL